MDEDNIPLMMTCHPFWLDKTYVEFCWNIVTSITSHEISFDMEEGRRKRTEAMLVTIHRRIVCCAGDQIRSYSKQNNRYKPDVDDPTTTTFFPT